MSAQHGPGSAASAALQSVGVLSVLVFLVAYTHEVLAFKGLHGGQILLLGLLQLLLALWALGEVLRLQAKAQPLPLRRLRFALLVQLGIGLVRYPLGPMELIEPSLLFAPDSPLGLGLASGLASLHLLILLVVSKLLIEAFAFAERQRADMLRAEVAERERAEAELREAREAAEAASRAKSAFLANMSHEIRTPLSGVLGMAQIGLRRAEDQEQRECFRKIDASARLLLAILNDVLDLSKIEAGKLRLEAAPFELGPLLAELRALVEPSAREKGLALHLDAPPEPGLWVGDRLRLSQVLLNLLSNAIKFTPAGEVRLVCARPAPGRLRLEVHDTGIGLSDAQQARVFEPFVQGDDSTTRQYGGTGLGLAISRQLVESMGGRLEVNSAPGRGSCFAFELPASDPACATPAETPSPPAGETPRWPGRRLLLAEDSELVREVLLRMLLDTELALEVAHDGLEAVAKCDPQPPDLVLMDIQMPGIDGHEAARRILARHPDLPIVALTAHALAEDVEKSRAAGMRGHLVKPVTTEALHAALREHLGEGAARPAPSPENASTPTAAAALPDVPGIDQRLAERLVNGDRDLFLRLLDVFVEAHGDAVARAREDLAAGASASAARRLHTLRGGARRLGAVDVAVLAEELEDAITQGETELQFELDALDQALNTVLDASAAIRGRARHIAADPPSGHIESQPPDGRQP